MRTHYALLSALITVFIPMAGLAKPSLSTAGEPTALPPQNARRAFQKKNAAPIQLNADTIAKDPNQLVLYFEQNPDKLKIDTMPPELAVTVAQLLIQARSWILAEKVLHDAVQKWPDRLILRRLYTRILVQLGRPAAARRFIEPVIQANDRDPVSHFLKGLATYRMQPQTEALTAEAKASFRKTIALDPNFRDSSGWQARDIQRQLNRRSSSSSPSLERPSVP
ncbi:MAG: hypothetical protein VX589_14735 [Myxococcota bacterium]|nr:hypothetical protein [Myxococcota bacterium]